MSVGKHQVTFIPAI